jgi:hypothetical protein
MYIMAEAVDSKIQDFGKLIRDMVVDLTTTFPELVEGLDPDLAAVKDGSLESADVQENIRRVREYCQGVLPPHFFDVLYQNADIFGQESEANAKFLPGIDFKVLWAENISDQTRETIWKYLQLATLSVASGLTDQHSFGDTAKLFEAIGEDEFKSKLEETIANIHTMFEQKAGEEGEGAGSGEPSMSASDLPDPQAIHDHLTGMMNGKLGALAREIAEETARDMQVDLENATTANDVFKKLFKNPASLMKIVKNVGSKLDDRLKSGEIKESELLAEAQELMQKMKDMPGAEGLQGLLGKMGMGGGKLNTGAMKAQLERQMKLAQTKERLRAKTGAKREAQPTLSPEEKAAAEAKAAEAAESLLKELGEGNYVFSSGGGAQRSSKTDKPGGAKKGKKKKKGKK